MCHLAAIPDTPRCCSTSASATWSLVADGAEHAPVRKLQDDLTAALERSHSQRARDNIAMSLAQLDSDSASVKDQLAAMVSSDQTQRAVPAALGLAHLGDPRGFAYVRASLSRKDDAAYASALQLAEARVNELEALIEHDPGAGMIAPQLLAAVAACIAGARAEQLHRRALRSLSRLVSARRM